MYLKKITTRNLQNHRDIIIDLPATGLVIFTGPNSNGKSVIVKTTRTLLSGKLSKPRKRAALVNREAQYAEIIYERDDGVVLTVHIAREANLTFTMLEIPNEDPVRRYLADKSYLDLAYRFGWHYDEQTGISLNIAEAEDALLFYKTSYKDNGSLLHSAITDTMADKTAINFDATIKDTRKLRDNYQSQVATITSTLADLKVEEIAPLQDKKLALLKFMRILETIYFPNVPEIKPVPNVSYVEVYKPVLPALKYPRIIQLSCKIPNILPIASDLKQLSEHKCPMCGRGFDCAC